MNYKYFNLTILLIILVQTLYAQGPAAAFNSDITSGCSPIIVNFKDLSTGNPTSWYWDFGNGGTSTLQNPSTTYLTPGTHTVKLVVTNANGSDSVSKEAYINVVSQPNVNFTSDKTLGCAPDKIQFKDATPTEPGTSNTSWAWDFGDGTQSTDQNPSHNYTSPDKFTVTLKVTNSAGCSKVVSKANSIVINPGINTAFNNSDAAVCNPPANINFTNNSTGPGTLSYNWIFDNGSTSNSKNVTHTYTSAGTFPVSLVVSSNLGCIDTLTKNIAISNSKTNFIAPITCQQAKTQLIDSSSPTPVRRIWTFPDGSTDTAANPSITFPTAGSYQVKLVNNFGSCMDSITKTITVSPKPTFDFTVSDSSKCQPPLTTNFSTVTGGNTYQWDFGDGSTSSDASPQHTYNALGSYSVTLIANSSAGCVDTVTKNDLIKIQKPNVSFKIPMQGGCLPFTFEPSADITTLDKVVSYQWDFGDGGTSSDPNPQHTYNNIGTYKVTLTITTSSGCTQTDSLPQRVKVGTQPKAEFTANQTDVCASTAIQFTDKSTPSDSVDFWIWKFGDGSISNQQNPSHEFSDTGLLNVQLVAYNNGCASKPLNKPNFVHIKPPISTFSYQPNCSTKTDYTFTDHSIGAKTWQWDFGDGSPKVNATNPPVHKFPGLGTYNVTLNTTNGDCAFQIVRTVRIFDKTPDFTAASPVGCKPFNAQLTASSPDAGSIKQYNWNFGDGHTGTGGSSANVYLKPGNYTVKLTTTDTFGCVDTKTKNQYIRVNGPTASFSSITHTGCKGLNATFEDKSSTDSVNALASWTWNYGDGTSQTYTQPPFQHEYDSLGNFTVLLTVKDAAGCTDSISNTNFVKISQLKADWDVTRQTCPSSPVSFKNNTYSNNGFTSLWNFGNGDSSRVSSVNYAYKDTGTYTVKLTVRDTLGCEDSLVRPQYVQVYRPVADFTANNFISYCIPFEAKFTNTSTYYNGWLWDLSTGTSGQKDPINFYTNAGKYNVRLTVYSPGGCMDTVTKQVQVFNLSDAKFKYAPLSGCRPVLTSFEAFAPINAHFVWDFRDGNVVDTTVNKIQHLYAEPGNFVPTVILNADSGACVIPLVGVDTIHSYGAKARFSIDKALFCDSGSVHLMDSTFSNDAISSYNWNFGDGTSSSDPKDSVHYYNNPGTYDVFLTVKTKEGCIDSLRSQPIKVVQSPLIGIQGDSIICINDRMIEHGILKRSDTSAVKWVWNFPNGNAAMVQDPANQQYTTAGSFVITTVATNSSGCTDTTTKNILVNPLPVITLPPTVTKQVGQPVTLPGTYSSNVISYSWSPDSTLSCADCAQPVATPKFNTKYTVSVIDSNGCKNTSEIQVIILCKNSDVFVPNTFSPNGDGSNDVFYVRGRGLERVKTLRVFNRWGEVVFEKKDFGVNDASAGWDGRYKGNRAQADVYVYQVEVYCENGEVLSFAGNIALIQ